MAKEKRSAGEARDFNEDFEASRQDAREKSGNVVNLNQGEDIEKTLVNIRNLTTEFAKLKAEGKAINESRKSVLERIDAAGLDRSEFKALAKLLEVDEEKRALKARTRQLFLKAHNLPEQVDLFANVDDEEPKAGIDGGVAAAIESGWLDGQRGNAQSAVSAH